MRLTLPYSLLGSFEITVYSGEECDAQKLEVAPWTLQDPHPAPRLGRRPPVREKKAKRTDGPLKWKTIEGERGEHLEGTAAP